ncbi:MAG: tryptophan--tRNA ligase [Candidatus Cloacimonetes bacterium]|nr:tryptophan--tRNA ligase [Candidatus Cloacimonadota bacterium]
MTKRISCTGIKPTGIVHLGNYLGSIKPSIELAKEYDARYFIADYHALNSIKNPKTLRENTYGITACWLACGLDPEKAIIYRQSSVPGTFEISTFLMAFTAKGLMNRAHAYKASVAKNLGNNKNPDDQVNMGLFTYPILMAADVIQFDSDVVPVGKDQTQHMEMMIDIAQSINSFYGKELFKIPKAVIHESMGVITGLDGRKMSKSYDNTIPLFLPPKKLRKLIMKIVTNSQSIEEPKDPDKCNVFALYKHFSSEDQIEKLRSKYLEGGMGWGHAKQELFEVVNDYLTPFRDNYDRIIQDKAYINEVLEKGSAKIRIIVEKKLEVLRKEVGLR